MNHRAHLFIPMWERSYTKKTPKWIVSDVEFIPDDWETLGLIHVWCGV